VAPAPPAVTREPEQPFSELPANDPYVRLGKLPREEQREILRRCASDWDRMKREGAVTGRLWRDFLETCLPDQK
jgi:hypothetical protein